MQLVKNVIAADLTPHTWVEYNGENKKLIRINDKTVVIQDGDIEKRISRNEIEGKVIKYTVRDIVTKKVFEVLYSDYMGVAEHNAGDFVEGYITSIKTKAKLGMSVRINDLSTLNKFKLEGVNVYGIVVGRNNSNYTILLQNGAEISIHRTKFILDNEKDVKLFFKPKIEKVA
jgi:hypothetical protein